MKKRSILLGAAVLSAGLSGCSVRFSGPGFFTWLLGVLGLLIAIFGVFRIYSTVQYNRRQRARGRKLHSHGQGLLTAIVFVTSGILMTAALLTCYRVGGSSPSQEQTQATTLPEETTLQETTAPALSFQPHAVEDTEPGNWGISWEIFQGDTPVSAYQRQDPIAFYDPEDYFTLPGVSTFRGNNYRNSATYGTASVTQQTVSTLWDYDTTTLTGSTWSGSGWTGQPIIVQWEEQVRNNMNLYPEKKAKNGLIEVIYATLDGHIYFLDLEDGSQTRDPLNIGQCFKGAGTLDPRGYPLMYVGSGDVNIQGSRPRMYIISLIDGSVLFEYGHEEALSLRKDNDRWCAFDSAPLVHAATDTLIWPGESGILYTMRLNSSYDAQGGAVSVAPDSIVKTRYDTGRSNADSYWYGYEASVNMVENYLYVSENGGMFYCIDINTMELVWAQDTRDDSNSTPVFERTGEDQGYVYTAPSLHWTRSADMDGNISIYKLDAITGEVVWERSYKVNTVDGVSGGVQSSPLLGKPGTALEGLIIYSIARTPEDYSGLLVALDTQTGREVWRMDMTNYTWSSPVAVYTEDGSAYVLVGDYMGYMFLLSAKGELLDSVELNGLIEASPAVYEDKIVVGTRDEKIFAIQIQ